MQVLHGEKRRNPATPRNQYKQQSTTDAEENCKKQCGARDSRPNHTEEAATLHTADMIYIYIYIYTVKSSKSTHTSM
jgi:hypothetical protein